MNQKLHDLHIERRALKTKIAAAFDACVLRRATGLEALEALCQRSPDEWAQNCTDTDRLAALSAEIETFAD